MSQVHLQRVTSDHTCTETVRAATMLLFFISLTTDINAFSIKLRTLCSTLLVLMQAHKIRGTAMLVLLII